MSEGRFGVKYHGRGGVVYMSTTGSGNAINVIGLTEWTINRTTDRVETTEFGAANKTYVQGYPDLTGNLSGHWDDTDDTMYQASTSADGARMYLYPSRDAPSKYWYGPAWVDFSMTVSNTDSVRVSGTFAANGDWHFRS